jgi:3-hydroxyisobutyrate dehydrogenase
VLRLLQEDHEVCVFNRTKAKLDRVQAAGAKIADSPQNAIEASEATILMLTDAEAINAVIMQDSVLPSLIDRTIIQMGTIAPQESLQFQTRVLASGGSYLEAPVLGSVPHINAGKLKVLVGGDVELCKRWEELLSAFGMVFHVGKVGSAATMKLARNQLIASLLSAYSLSLNLLESEKLSIDTFMQILRQDALFAPILDKKLDAMLGGEFAQASFAVKNLLKDVDLFLAEGR